MTNTLTNYTNAQRAEFIQAAIVQGKRIEKYEDTLYALAENEVVENGEIITDDERPQRLKHEQFEREFFETSLGWVRRKVTMQDGTVRDFLTDILPLLFAGVVVLTYDEDLNQRKVEVTKQFLEECKQQLFMDFWQREPLNYSEISESV